MADDPIGRSSGNNLTYLEVIFKVYLETNYHHLEMIRVACDIALSQHWLTPQVVLETNN